MPDRIKNKRTQLLQKHLKLDKSENKSKKKFIVIQVDGLGYSVLQKIRKTKHMPFLRQFLLNNNLEPWDCGYPSTTPFVQAGIMYGWNQNIPGFRFFDKKNSSVLSMGSGRAVNHIEEEIEQQGNPGILEGGTSISNILSGGAERSILTVRHLFKHGSDQKKIKDILKVVLLNPMSAIKVLGLSIYEFFLELYESFAIGIPKKLRGELVNWPFYQPYMPFMRMGVNSIIREIATESALVEMERDVPYLYVTYGGYDWISHYRGPNAVSSYGALDQIDFSVRKVVRKAQKKGYDVYIISDHGQVDSVPFEKIYYEEFDKFIENASRLKVKDITGNDERSSREKFVYYKLKHYYNHFSLPLKGVSWLGLKILEKSLPKIVPPRLATTKQEIVLLLSSCLAQLYLTKSKERLSISQIEDMYPFMIERIVQHKGIGFIIGKEKEKIIVLAQDGKYEINKKGFRSFGNRFLPIYGEEERLIDQIREFANLKYSGDLILNGAYDGEKFVAFEHFHFGTHDGIGGNQSIGFFASKQKMDFSKVKNAAELYKIFRDYHEK
jgi:hypothetical protein